MGVNIKNYMEICVIEFLDGILEQYPEVCSCDACKSDIVALALNKLPPRYTTSDIGQLYTKVAILNIQYRTDIYKAIVQAIGEVKKNPHHSQP